MKTTIMVLLFCGIIFAQTDTSQYNPCKDKVLLQLQHKDSLTTDEMKIYVELRKLCEQNQQSQKENKNNLRGVYDDDSIYGILALGLIAVGVMIYFISIEH